MSPPHPAARSYVAFVSDHNPDPQEWPAFERQEYQEFAKAFDGVDSLGWVTVERTGAETVTRVFGSAVAAETWIDRQPSAMTSGCACDGVMHALDADGRQRTRRAMDRAIDRGQRDVAAHCELRLRQCPTARPNTTDTETSR